MDPYQSTTRLHGGLTPPLMSHAHLLLYHDATVTPVPLRGGVPVVLGRDPTANVVLLDASLSRTHARLTFDGKHHVVIQDLGSTNGTILKGHSLDKPTPVSHGAEIYFGAVLGIVHIPLAQAIPIVTDDGDIVKDAETMKRVLGLVEKYANAAAPVLIGGETGTGKEEIAKLIHRRSPRKDKPFVVLNCASIPPQLVESLLFGHERGAFTGASSQTKGYFEEAHGGTLLLDEIGELSLAAQAALLRVLETGRIVRVGSVREIPLDLRLIAATWRDLKTMCKHGAFREDLFHRLSVLTLDVPPLRDRREDIPALVGRFLQRANKTNARHVQSIDDDALRTLIAYDWPGNIRELRNSIERAVVVTSGEKIRLEDLPAHIEAKLLPTNLGQGSLNADKGAVVKAALVEALRQAKGDTEEAAKLLGISRRTLQRLVKKHGINTTSGGDA